MEILLQHLFRFSPFLAIREWKFEMIHTITRALRGDVVFLFSGAICCTICCTPNIVWWAHRLVSKLEILIGCQSKSAAFDSDIRFRHSLAFGGWKPRWLMISLFNRLCYTQSKQHAESLARDHLSSWESKLNGPENSQQTLRATGSIDHHDRLKASRRKVWWEN